MAGRSDRSGIILRLIDAILAYPRSLRIAFYGGGLGFPVRYSRLVL